MHAYQAQTRSSGNPSFEHTSISVHAESDRALANMSSSLCFSLLFLSLYLSLSLSLSVSLALYLSLSLCCAPNMDTPADVI